MATSGGAAFLALVDAYAQHLRARSRAPATIQSRRYGLRALGAWVDAHHVDDVRQLGRAEVDAYVASVRAPKVKAAPHTIEGRICALKGLFRFLVESNRILLSPAEHVRERNLSHMVGATVTVAQAGKLLAAPNTSLPIGVRDRALIELLYGTGLRRDEVRKVGIFDVDLVGGLLRVEEGKGGKARVVPLGSQAAHWLGVYLEHVRPQLARRKNARPASHVLFLGRSGEDLSGPALGKIVDAAARAAGVRVSCHALRRTMATEMLRGGADLVTVSRILGHACLSTTQRYTKVETPDLRLVHARHHPRGR